MKNKVTVSMSVQQFFGLSEVKRLQDVMKVSSYGSKAHREAFDQMAALAHSVGGDLGEYL